jgi:hypothetical protein
VHRGLAAADALHTLKKENLISYEILWEALKSSGYNFRIKGIIKEKARYSYRDNDHLSQSPVIQEIRK